MASRHKSQRTGTTNSEGHSILSNSSTVTTSTPGKKTTTRTGTASIQRQNEDEGGSVKFSIPIKGIC